MQIHTIPTRSRSLGRRLVKLALGLSMANLSLTSARALALTRKGFELGGQLGCSLSVNYCYSNIAGINCLTLSPKRTRQAIDPRIMIFCHGGGYVLGSCASHKAMVSHMVAATGISAVLFDYRLAPEHAFPAQLHDTYRVYSTLLQRYNPNQIILIGDSAGGALVMHLLITLKQQAQPMPACAVAMYPWVDYRNQAESIDRNNGKDPLLTKDTIMTFATHTFGNDATLMDQYNLLNADMSGLPPILLQVGTEDILFDSNLQFMQQLKHHHNAGEAQIWQHMPHAWISYIGLHRLGLGLLRIYPESAEAIKHLKAFILKHTNAPKTHTK